jgi:uncharacterized protein YecE (DUF72 family)
MPNRKTLEAWREATPVDFRFALKVSRKITHFERLRLPSDALDYLLGVVSALGERLGILLFQLPPNFKADPDRLALLLGSLPSTLGYAFEFRHDSWFAPEIYALLRAHDAALCIHDADDRTTPIERTAVRSYARLRKSEYSESALLEWRDRLTAWERDGVDVFAFFKHEDNPDAPRMALEFARICREGRARG